MSAGPFALFGIDPKAPWDQDAFRRRYLAMAREAHPDRHQDAGPEELARLEAEVAALNVAYGQLANPSSRLDHAILAVGGPSAADRKQLPGDFLEEVLELRAELDEADRPGREAMADRLRERRRAAHAEGHRLLAEGQAEAARDVANAVKYLDGLIREIAVLDRRQ